MRGGAPERGRSSAVQTCPEGTAPAGIGRCDSTGCIDAILQAPVVTFSAVSLSVDITTRRHFVWAMACAKQAPRGHLACGEKAPPPLGILGRSKGA